MNRVKRAGELNSVWLAFLGSVVVLIALVVLLVWDPQSWFASAPPKEPLVVYCAAGLRTPVEAAAKEYEKDYGIPVQIHYGGSQTLLAGIEVSHKGDVYIPADDSFVKTARDKKLINEMLPLARMAPVLAVPKGNPKNLRSVEDLVKPDVRLAQGNSDATAIGAVTRIALEKAGQWDALKARTVVFKLTVNDVANDVQVGAADAGIVWNAVVRQTPGLEAVSLKPFAGVSAFVAATILTDSKQPTAALRFARFLAARDRGLVEFGRYGYDPVEGDAWAEEPNLRLLSGAMLRPAIEETITAFEQREGVRVTRVYNGCGILVGQMKAGARPDMYFACDKSFMNDVADLFVEQQDISMNQLVILVPKGNPHGVRTLVDLGKPGLLRVGIGHEKQCALGVLTQRTLKESGVQAEVKKNVKVETPTGDMLVNEIRTGSLDAVVAYVSNAAAAGDQLEAIAIDIPCAMAVQPLGAGKASDHKHLTGRLIDAIRSADSRRRFESNGFRWQAAAK